LHGLAVDGEGLAKLYEVVGLGTAEGTEAELGDNLAHAESGAGGAFGGAAGAWDEAGGREKGALLEGLSGKNSGGIVG
jgi:hypothetical protein